VKYSALLKNKVPCSSPGKDQNSTIARQAFKVRLGGFAFKTFVTRQCGALKEYLAACGDQQIMIYKKYYLHLFRLLRLRH
jgi:hypothetical protein